MRPPHILTTPQQQHVRFAKPLVHSCRRHRAAAVRAYFAFFAIDGAVAVAVEAGQETGLIAFHAPAATVRFRTTGALRAAAAAQLAHGMEIIAIVNALFAITIAAAKQSMRQIDRRRRGRVAVLDLSH